MFSILIFSIFCSEFGEQDDEDVFYLGDSPLQKTRKEVDWSKAKIYDVIIIGSGPAGSTAADYTARADLSTIVFHGRTPGGQLTKTTIVENFPAFTGTGPELVKKAQKQAEDAGAVYIDEEVIDVNLTGKLKKIQTDAFNGYYAKAVIICTGATPRYLGIPNEEKYKGNGISICASCDGPLFSKKSVCVIGGGNTAVHEAIYLSRICKSVKLFVRSSKLDAAMDMQKKLKESRVDVIYDSEAVEFYGGRHLEGVKIKNIKTNEIKKVDVCGVFLAIGSKPATENFASQIQVDSAGYFDTNDSPKTKIPGVFVAGDCMSRHHRQAAIAAGLGCKAGMMAIEYVQNGVWD